uniref:Uncharacterized protein n=1 Tax=Ananas comosus var. bracteatus TaxID=296719 RepID=A0A6V7PJS9_ANACO|nr:unnamed protein product [Ananas comosus var. bracteatus]
MVRQLLKHDTSPAYVSDTEGLCPIHVASRLGRSDVVRELVNRCPDLDELVNKEGRNFFHIAVEHGSAEIVKFVCQSLLFMKMINSKDNDGNTPLRLAEASRTKPIQFVSVSGYDGDCEKFPNWKWKPAEEEEEEEEEEEDQTVFGGEMERMDDELLDALAQELPRSCRRQKLCPPYRGYFRALGARAADLCQRLLPPGGTQCGARDTAALCCKVRSRPNCVPLYLGIPPVGGGAARKTALHTEVLRVTLRATNRVGKTALHVAAEEGHVAVARVLVSADPGLAALVDNSGASPLYAAVLSKSLQVVQILIESESPAEGGKQAAETTSTGATQKISYAGPKGRTALHAAAIVQSPGS